MHGSPRGLRGWQQGHRPSGPDPGNAGGGKLSEQRSYDAVIVGGGVIGLASAWRLAQAGATVAVLERDERPPAGATRVAAGMLAPVGELTFGEPALLELTLVRRRAVPGLRRRARGGERGRDRLRGARGAARGARPRRGRAASPRPRPAAQHGPRGRVAAAARLPRPGARPDALAERGRGRAGRGLGRPARAERRPAGGAAPGGSRGADRDRGERGPDRGRADRRRPHRGRRGAARRRGRPRLRRLVGPGRVAAGGRPPAGAPGQGPDPRAALSRRRDCADRADRRLRARLPGAARGRAPDRRRHGRGTRLRHRGHRRRGPRAAARGLPPAPRRRRDGAGRGDGGAAPRHARTTCPRWARAPSTA